MIWVRMRRGHVFQCRYKSAPVNADGDDSCYFGIVADYIHLNPARAGLTGGGRGRLSSYKWSSIKSYETGKGSDWLVMGRVDCDAIMKVHGRKAAFVGWERKEISEGVQGNYIWSDNTKPEDFQPQITQMDTDPRR